MAVNYILNYNTVRNYIKRVLQADRTGPIERRGRKPRPGGREAAQNTIPPGVELHSLPTLCVTHQS